MGTYLLENVSDLILHGQQKRFGGLSSFDDFTTNADEVWIADLAKKFAYSLFRKKCKK